MTRLVRVVSVVGPGFSPERSALKGGPTSTIIRDALGWVPHLIRHREWRLAPDNDGHGSISVALEG